MELIEQGAILVSTQTLAAASPRVVEQLEAADERQTTKTIFAGLASLNVERLTAAMCGDVEPIGSDATTKRVANMFAELKKGRNYSVKVVSLIAERIFESMLLRGFRAEAMELTYLIGEEVLRLLTGEHEAIRRLRFVNIGKVEYS